MALKDNELYSSTTVGALKNIAPTSLQPKNFGPGSGTIAPLTPVAFDTANSYWVVWTSGGANGTGTIKGFLYGDNYGATPGEGITLDAADETIGVVMMAGKIDYNDIVLPSGEAEADLKTALRTGVRDAGILVYNLDQVR